MKLVDWLRLVFAVGWLAGGALICVLQAMHPASEWAWFPIGEVKVSVGWFAILLGLYNLARWWAARAMRASRTRAEELASRDPRTKPRRKEEPPAEPDPNFDFSDRPPAAGDHRNGSS